MRDFINIHTHHPTQLAATMEIESVYWGQSRIPSAEWLSVGLHPWYLKDIDWLAAEQWLREMAQNSRVVAVGEAGLDKACASDWETQLRAFRLCLQTADELQKPLVIHCVRAHAEVLAELHNFPALKGIFHGFDKHPQTADMLLKAGCYLSFGAAILNPEKQHARNALLETPVERLFLETDNANVPIETIYREAATLRNIGLHNLQSQVKQNYLQVFGPFLV